MRRIILGIAAVAAFGLMVPTLTSQAQAQGRHGIVVQGGGYGYGGGGWQRGHRANRPFVVRRGYGAPRRGVMVAPGMGRYGVPRMHRRY